jgi:putative oligomerization/nucleic acid binding protein
VIRRRIGRPGLLGTVARTAVIAGTATAVSGGMRRAAESREAQQAAAPVPAPAMTPDERIAKIKELGELRDSGLLSEEEFAAEKAKVLAM